MSCSPFSYRIYSIGYVFEYLNHLSRFRCERSFRRWLGYLIVDPHRAVCHEVFFVLLSKYGIDCIRHSVQSLIEPLAVIWQHKTDSRSPAGNSG